MHRLGTNVPAREIAYQAPSVTGVEQCSQTVAGAEQRQRADRRHDRGPGAVQHWVDMRRAVARNDWEQGPGPGGHCGEPNSNRQCAVASRHENYLGPGRLHYNRPARLRKTMTTKAAKASRYQANTL